MIRKIKNTEDVIKFAKELVNESVCFHCDDDFNDYINLENKKKTYTKRQANFRNNLMEQSFEVCDKNGVDIYALMNDVLVKETGLSKFYNQ
mgnify:CR=1 FL=1